MSLFVTYFKKKNQTNKLTISHHHMAFGADSYKFLDQPLLFLGKFIFYLQVF